MRPFVIILTILFCAACQKTKNHAANYQVTRIPFNIDNLTDDQSRVIREGNASDTSAYLIRTRPVMFQIVGTRNNADESRGPNRIEQDAEILMYGLGEAQGGELVDYGWLENVETGARVWEMSFATTVYAGGDQRNRKKVSRITLPPGVYRLRYVSNGTHAFTEWQGAAPEHEHLYGITMFNMTALPGIDKRLKEAGVPVLATSLERANSKTTPARGTKPVSKE